MTVNEGIYDDCQSFRKVVTSWETLFSKQSIGSDHESSMVRTYATSGLIIYAMSLFEFWVQPILKSRLGKEVEDRPMNGNGRDWAMKVAKKYADPRSFDFGSTASDLIDCWLDLRNELVHHGGHYKRMNQRSIEKLEGVICLDQDLYYINFVACLNAIMHVETFLNEITNLRPAPQ